MRSFLLAVLLSCLLLSCARVGSPIGGDKDSLAPKFLRSNIDTTRVNIPINTKELRLDFDEYVMLKDIQKNLNISPPLKNIKKIVPSSLASRFILIQWTDTLQANTTYNFNFGNAIADNNEGNVLRYFNMAFSTGPKLDSTYISGEIKDPTKIKATSGTENKLVVGLYKYSDSMNYKARPYYVAAVDDDGYYELNYLSSGKYKILAWDDENSNSIFDSGKEKVAFLKDSIVLDKSISGLNLKLQTSEKRVKYNDYKEIPGGVIMNFEGNPKDVKVELQSDKKFDYKVTHRPKSDSVMIWFNAKKSNIGIESIETLKFNYTADTIKNKSATIQYKLNDKNEFTINNLGEKLLAPKSKFKLTSNHIIDKIIPEQWKLTVDSLNTQTFKAEISPTNPYQILIESDFVDGKKYQITLPKGSVLSYFDELQKAHQFNFEYDKVENYGNLELILENKPTSYFWVQLLDATETVKYQQYTNADVVKFDYLLPGEYIVKMLVDNNNNHFWDPASLNENRYAEDYYILYKAAVIRPLWLTKEPWDMKDTRVFDIKTLTNPPKTEKKDEKNQEQNQQRTNDPTINNQNLNRSGTLQRGNLQLNR